MTAEAGVRGPEPARAFSQRTRLAGGEPFASPDSRPRCPGGRAGVSQYDLSRPVLARLREVADIVAVDLARP